MEGLNKYRPLTVVLITQMSLTWVISTTLNHVNFGSRSLCHTQSGKKQEKKASNIFKKIIKHLLDISEIIENQ